MIVRLAKSAGFCFGVKRAVDQVYEQTKTGKKIYTYGPIIHNEEVVKDLETKGVTVLEENALEGLQEGTVIIRSHGVERTVCDQITNQGLECVDATCPFVKRIHLVVEKESKGGKQIVIVGSKSHAEVVGIMGWSLTPVVVIESEEDATQVSLPFEQEICLVSQTTFQYNKFEKIVEILENRGYQLNVVNTICNATQERQTEARELAKEADVMIVIGGLQSSNSRKLYEICAKECENTYFIQTLADLQLNIPSNAKMIGITAGASTPNHIIEEVYQHIINITK